MRVTIGSMKLAVLALGATGALAIAGCGNTAAHQAGAGGYGASSPPAAHTAPATQTTSSVPATKPASDASASAIPQHNGGDHDADNNGAPSDGDGNQ
ncbi:MAG: hypothetical protein ACR2QA_00815 [Solirubrobacteraceae bacterium]